MSEARLHVRHTHAHPPARGKRLSRNGRITIALRCFHEDPRAFVKPNITPEIVLDNPNMTNLAHNVIDPYPKVGRARSVFVLALLHDTL